jgi:hypothetical protein
LTSTPRPAGGGGARPGRLKIELYFSDYFGVKESALKRYGAFNISLVSDLPLFIDPFLLFHSHKPEYQTLHQDMLRYLRFLRDKATDGRLPAGLVASWYRFGEVKQNWLGFSAVGNKGHGLGKDFGLALHESLRSVFGNLGSETITASTHLEKLGLLRGNVGRDCISDFTTNLIKEYLLEYTQAFARKHLAPGRRRVFPVREVRFNYGTEAWEDGSYELPAHGDDYVLLTPADILTRDDTWISRADLERRFAQIPEALPDDRLRAQVSNYFHKHLSENPSARERAEAVRKTLREFPELIDYYIKMKEETGDEAESVSSQRVEDTRAVFVDQAQALIRDLSERTTFFDHGANTYDEALLRVKAFKHYVENQDGYRLINKGGEPFSTERDVQTYFGLIWYGTASDVNREPNNGRGPVDYKISKGAFDKTLVEFKLGSNSQLKRNLEKQVEIYEKANGTRKSIKVIVCYTQEQEDRVRLILEELKLSNAESVVVIDARSDNKPSASKA